jgi:stress-induced morphogen
MADIPNLPFKFTKAGKIRLLTLEEMDKRTAAYKRVQQRIKAIEEEEFGGEPTIRQHQAVVNDVLLSMMGGSMGVLHLSGQSLDPARLTAVINSQRQERKSRNE